MDEKAHAERAQRFRALHASGTFVIANCWDGGSARILTSLGFPALATSSGASAGTLGRLDGDISINEALAQARTICGSTSLPVSADLEKGFGDDPAATASAIALAAETGLVGGSIEDATGRKDAPIFDLGLATERVASAAEAARKLPYPFTLTARAENYLHGRPDLDDTIKRLQAFERAGADVLFAPGLPDLAAVRTVCSSLGKPVNFMVGIHGKSFSVAELAAAGVRRISLATSLYRAAMTGLAEAAREIRESGTFDYLDDTMTSGDFARYLQGRR
jgi:2-methylisocitrate lyase-like PEP mutase family enzyme